MGSLNTIFSITHHNIILYIHLLIKCVFFKCRDPKDWIVGLSYCLCDESSTNIFKNYFLDRWSLDALVIFARCKLVLRMRTFYFYYFFKFFGVCRDRVLPSGLLVVNCRMTQRNNKNIGYQLPVAGWKSKQQIAMILKSRRHTQA